MWRRKPQFGRKNVALLPALKCAVGVHTVVWRRGLWWQVIGWGAKQLVTWLLNTWQVRQYCFEGPSGAPVEVHLKLYSCIENVVKCNSSWVLCGSALFPWRIAWCRRKQGQQQVREKQISVHHLLSFFTNFSSLPDLLRAELPLEDFVL